MWGTRLNPFVGQNFLLRRVSLQKFCTAADLRQCDATPCELVPNPIRPSALESNSRERENLDGRTLRLILINKCSPKNFLVLNPYFFHCWGWFDWISWGGYSWPQIRRCLEQTQSWADYTTPQWAWRATCKMSISGGKATPSEDWEIQDGINGWFWLDIHWEPEPMLKAGRIILDKHLVLSAYLLHVQKLAA